MSNQRIAQILTLCLFACLGISSARAQATDTTRVLGLDLTGDCAGGSKNVSEAGDALTAVTDGVFAEDSPSVEPELAVRDCLVSVQLAHPRGFSVTHIDWAYRGFAKLLAGRTGKLHIRYLLEGREIGMFKHAFEADQQESFALEDVLAVPSLALRAGQKQTLQLAIHIEITGEGEPAADDYSALAFDAIDGSLAPSLVWRFTPSRTQR